MNVDFSQIGQNIADKKVQVNSAAVESTERNVTNSEKAAILQTQNSQDLADKADTSSSNGETRDRAALNIESAVSEINDFVQARNRQLNFSVDEGSERAVVKVTDSESGDIIRQIPSEEVLALSERIKELQTDVGTAVGVLFNKQA